MSCHQAAGTADADGESFGVLEKPMADRFSADDGRGSSGTVSEP